VTSPLPASVDPAETALRKDLAHVRMCGAADGGRFGIVRYQHPCLLAWVQVGAGRLGLRLDVVGYPGAAPAGQPWNLETNTPLPTSRWPVGGRPVFRLDWSVANGNAPYLAVDRVALRTHPNWMTELPSRAWNSCKTVYDYLAAVQEALSLSRLPEAS
jgi:hypothetical protein